MAPALLGPTLTASCLTCAYAFPLAAETYRVGLPTRCPNCGGLCGVPSELRPGQTVQLERLADLSDVQRWDLIAFRHQPSHSTQVKRVWGLPGEVVELRHGEAWIDGIMLRKSLAELRQVAVPVYELSRGGAGQWWCSEPAGEPAPVATKFAAGSLRVLAGQRLHLGHVRPAPVHPADVSAAQWQSASPVVDDYPINQGLSIQQHIVKDGLIWLQLQRPLRSGLRIGVRVAASDGERVLHVLFEAPQASFRSHASPELQIAREREAVEADFTMAAHQRIEMGWCDGRLLLKTDLQSRVVGAEELRSLPTAAQGLDPEWALHEICRLETSRAVDIDLFGFARDLYLISADGQAGEGGPAANEHGHAAASLLDGFYVLGDNLPASQDSRQKLGRVRPVHVLGRIVASSANKPNEMRIED